MDASPPGAIAMTNPFYTATGTPASQSRGVSSLNRNEFTNIQTAFDVAEDVLIGVITGSATGAVDSGVANAYVLTNVGTIDATNYITSYTDLLRVIFRTANQNSGASTININDIGVTNIVRSDGSALQRGDILADNPVDLTYNASAAKFYLNMGALGAPGTNGSAGTNATAVATYGDGSDGNVTISSGTTTLARNMFYNNLTISGTGSIDANGWQIFIKGTLDLTAAPAGAIKRLALAGGSAVTTTGGAATAIATENTVGAGGQGAAGANSSAGNGVQSTKTNIMQGGLGGATANAGANSAASAGGTGAAKPASVQSNIAPVLSAFIVGAAGSLARGGVGGSGGPSGANSAGNAGGAGGAGGNGGAVLDIRAQTISRGAGTAASAISCIGGTGGNATNAQGNNAGGGSGGAGGGGGLVQIAYTTLSGATATNCIDVSGGAGGAGGTGLLGGASGSGGSGGDGGQVRIFNTNAATVTINTSASTGSSNSGTTGGAGGVAKYDL